MKTAERRISRKKSWAEKFEKPMQAKIVDIPDAWAKKIGYGKMFIATPGLIDKFIRTIPRGKLVTINMIRNEFAAESNTETTCPVTTGIFTLITAWKADEDQQKGVSKITPYWRVLLEGGKLNPKFPGGIKKHATLLHKEGFQIVQGRSEITWRVKDYEKYLMKQVYEDVN